MESEPTFQLIEPTDVEIAGLPSADMTIRAAGRTLGRLSGFIVERAQQQICYLVVRASDLFGESTLVPFRVPRVDVEHHAIEVDVDERELWQLRHFTPTQLLAT
jgi:hypothetical protein